VRGRFSRPLRVDIRAITNIILSSEEIEIVDSYEKRLATYLGTARAISCAYARTAFWIVLKALNLKEGDKILLPAISIKPIVDVVLDLKLEPIFVDVDLTTGCVDIDSLRSQLKENPRVFLLTYLFGIVPDNLQEILNTISQTNTILVEDISQCFNGKFLGQRVGTFGLASILSTSSVKTLDTFGGGIVFTSNSDLANACLSIRDTLPAPRRKTVLKKALISHVKNLLSHRLIFTLSMYPLFRVSAIRERDTFSTFVGKRALDPINTLPQEWFSRLSSQQASLGQQLLPDIERFDRQRVSAVRFLGLSARILGVNSQGPQVESTFWQAIVLASNPKLVRKHLMAAGIDSSRTSLVLLSALNYVGENHIATTPNALRLHRHAIYLPCYKHLNKHELDRIQKALKTLVADGLIEAPNS
jgi:perosamine synthetase